MKDKFWYVRLSPNHRFLHYGDCDEKNIPALDELPDKLPVVEIRNLVTGKDCPHIKDARYVSKILNKGKSNNAKIQNSFRKQKTMSQYAFSLILDSNEPGSLDFVAPDQQTYDYWIDGINALLGRILFLIVQQIIIDEQQLCAKHFPCGLYHDFATDTGFSSEARTNLEARKRC